MGIYFLCVYIKKLNLSFYVGTFLHVYKFQSEFIISLPKTVLPFEFPILCHLVILFIHLFTQLRNPYRFSSSSLNPSVQSVTKLLISLQQHLSDLSFILHYLSQISLFLLELRNGVFPAITVNKD